MTVLETSKMIARFTTHAFKILPSANWNADKMLDERCRKTPNAMALAYLEERYTWQEIGENADKYASFLKQQFPQHRGVKATQTVALLMDNRPEFLFAFHGMLRLGLTTALVNTHLNVDGLVHAIKAAGADKLLIGEEHAAKLPAIMRELENFEINKDVFVIKDNELTPSDVDDNLIHHDAQMIDSDSLPEVRAPLAPSSAVYRDTACLIYTSGTTGLPKASIVTHGKLCAGGYAAGFSMVRTFPGDVIYIALPLYHATGLVGGWFAALGTGAGAAIRRKFSASSFTDDLRKFNATAFVYIGEFCRYLQNQPASDLDSQHQIKVAYGNGLRPDLWEDFQHRFNIPIIREFYGSTEGTAGAVNMQGRPGMVGKKIAGMLIVKCDLETGEPIRNEQGLCDVVSEGQTGLALGAINKLVIFDGYLDEEATRKKIIQDVKKKGDQYFNSGDLLKLHPGNWLSFEDRVGDTFRWKGENVSTNEVAEMVNKADGVLESNVYGVEIKGCEGRAGMGTISTAENFDLQKFARFVTDELPAFQRLLFIRLPSSEIEKTGTFKFQKVKARNERFDPGVISEPLYYLSKGEYLPIDQATSEAIDNGEIVPG